MLTAIVVVGFIANYVILFSAMQDEPEGAMGAGPALLAGLVPWLIVVVAIGSKIYDYFHKP